MKILLTFFVTFVFSTAVYAQDASFYGVNNTQQEFYGKNLQQCQSELASLSKLDPEAYQTNKAGLDYNMGRATRYLLLRSSLSGDIQSVMDSVHQANIAKSCQQIHQKLYAVLLKEAERN